MEVKYHLNGTDFVQSDRKATNDERRDHEHF
jgi:hypothetical protein